ncbi:MAG: dTMP kinase [Rickettsiales bacterium]|jgi:dTMP kinase|nr:dTMP kinase [Rickettsiales bacterium]OUT44365.1 MAG: dTMP kinase [Pelagibacteraceae bacterium TMED13]|tara:strand:- start:317 stop:958 length:642 start_codon:yes stop_codon:yes gene_type:complete
MKKFISFEGGEGVGKTTQSKLLSKSLKSINEKYIITREPGGTRESEIIRDLIVNNKYKNFLPETELLLIYAARHEHVKKLLIPTLKKNNVICDRFIHSTICYQIIMNKINIRKLKFLHKEFAFNLLPNISFFLNLNPKEGVKRSLSIKKTEIKYEKKENRFHEKIRAEFENLSKKDKHLINVDASNSIESIHRKIINILNKKKFFKKNLPYSI